MVPTDPLTAALAIAARLALRPHIPPDLAACLLCEWRLGVLATAEAMTEGAKAGAADDLKRVRAAT